MLVPSGFFREMAIRPSHEASPIDVRTFRPGPILPSSAMIGDIRFATVRFFRRLALPGRRL